MAKAVRFKVRWTLCDEVFQNDYAEKHTKSKHKDLHVSGRQAPITIELDKSDTRQSKMDGFFSAQLRLTTQIPVVRKRGKLPLALRLQNCLN